jgi:hypothetical protein
MPHLSRVLTALAVTLATACATAPRPSPASAAHGAWAGDSETDDADDDDGEPGDDQGSLAEMDGEDADEQGREEAGREAAPAPSRCPEGMASIDDRYCVDRYEASLVEILPDGTERPYPHYAAVDGKTVRAVSVPGVFPQGFISEVQAEGACRAAGKRLCTHDEWRTACMGPSRTTFPYGSERQAGVCHDSGKSAVVAVFGAKAVMASPVSEAIARRSSAGKKTTKKNAAPDKPGKKAHVTKARAATQTRARKARPAASATSTKKSVPRKSAAPTKKTAARKIATPTKKSAARREASAKNGASPEAVELNVWTRLNEPALGQVEGAVARTGEHPACESGYGVFDMVGNLHEWVQTSASLPHGTFAGGYYLDTSQNGDGCHYRTVAHAHDYHDYSTGFRCCADSREP